MGQARAAVAHAQAATATTSSSRRWTRRAPTSSSPPRCSRSRSRRARRRSTSPTPSATRCPRSTPRTCAGCTSWCPSCDDVVVSVALPRRPRPGGRQLARRRAGRRAPGRVRDQRHRRAGGQRLARGDRDAAAHARRRPSACAPASMTTRDRAHEPAGLAPDRLRRAAQQGGRRAQRVRARVGHPPGRRAQGAHDLRDHGRATSAWTPTDSCWASTPAATRCSRRWRSSASSVDGAGAEPGLQALQGDRRPQEAGHGDGPRGAGHRRAARGVAGLHVEWFEVEAASRRPPHATVGVTHARRRGAPRAVHRRRPGRRDLPRDQRRHGDRRASCASSASTRSRAARTRSARSSVVLELEGRPASGQGVSTDIIEAAGPAYVRALSNAPPARPRRGEGARSHPLKWGQVLHSHTERRCVGLQDLTRL